MIVLKIINVVAVWVFYLDKEYLLLMIENLWLLLIYKCGKRLLVILMRLMAYDE